MLNKVIPKEKRRISDYKEYISKELYSDIIRLAKQLRNLRVVVVNATPQGGGVAEILQSIVPLLNNLGVKTSWYTLVGDSNFFAITKKIHNALQGNPEPLAKKEKEYYLEKNKIFAEDLSKLGPVDAWVINDPQPLAAIKYFSGLHPSILHIHIDLSRPQKDIWNFLKPYARQYDKIIFSLKDFAKNDLPSNKVEIFPPAIDPLTDKNRPIRLSVAKNILAEFSINIDKPLVTQVSRFDPWKDPVGVIQAYYIAKNKIPDLQLALIGFQFAQDDPEANRIFEVVKKHAKGDPDIFLFSDPAALKNISNDMFVNAVQIASDVILQKSIKEGFGLVVTEAMWKRKAIVVGNAGGIKLQIKNGENGFIVSSPEQAAKRIVQFLEDKNLAKVMGEKAHKDAREKFLLPRLAYDYLKLLYSLRLPQGLKKTDMELQHSP